MNTTTSLAGAIELADKIRREHNGIMTVMLYLGHDGDNVCTFGTYDSNVGKGCSGESLLKAIHLALCDWRYLNLTTTDWGKKTVIDCVELAIEDFGGGDNLFNTAGFYQAINTPEAYAVLSDVQTRLLLENHPRIVRLSGGAHWMLLPKEHTRYLPDTLASQDAASPH